jgi:hypothetical protein
MIRYREQMLSKVHEILLTYYQSQLVNYVIWGSCRGTCEKNWKEKKEVKRKVKRRKNMEILLQDFVSNRCDIVSTIVRPSNDSRFCGESVWPSKIRLNFMSILRELFLYHCRQWVKFATQDWQFKAWSTISEISRPIFGQSLGAVGDNV